MKYLTAILLLALPLGCATGDSPSTSPGAGWSVLMRGAEEIRVHRDAWGIPHLYAKTVAGAFWAQGYTSAQDRFWEMELFRRGARGQAAELKGAEAAANDRDRLRRGYTEEELRAMFESGGERFRRAVSAYTEGVNAWLQSHPDLPPDYAALGETPRPWSETDSLAIGVAMARRFGEAGESELNVARVHGELVKKVGAANAMKIVDDLLREQDPTAPTTMNDHLRPAPEKKQGRAPGAEVDERTWARYLSERDEIFASRAAIGMPVYFGSNAWVAAPKKSKSGNPLLYGGPMMGFTTPSICNEVHLVAEGLEVAGMGFPGAPGVMIGWNANLAWTTTSGGSDLVDIYALDLNPENPEEYRYGGGWKKFEILERELRIRGREPEKVRVFRSVYGPLTGERDLEKHRAYSLRMSFWKNEQSTFEGVLDVNFARTIGDFQSGVRKIVTSHNFFCATKDGHIGFWFCGAHPVRKPAHDPRFPQDGKGGMEWEGLLPVEQWPQQIDPPGGTFANWNNKPTVNWRYAGYGEIFWGKKIIDVLEGEETLSAERFGQIARLTAYHAYLADYYLPHLLEAAKGSDDPAVIRGVELLSKWDRMHVEGSPGPVVLEKWLRLMMVRTFGHLIDPLMLANKDIQRYLADPLLYLLEGEKSRVKLKFDYAKGRDMKVMAREALKEALKGEDAPPAWKEPLIDFGGQVGKVKSMRGRGTYQMVVEMTPQGPRAWTLAAPGQSERPESKHYKDQIGLFEKWEYKPFAWNREEMK